LFVHGIDKKVSYRKQIARQHSWSIVKNFLTSSLIAAQNLVAVRMYKGPKIGGRWVSTRETGALLTP